MKILLPLTAASALILAGCATVPEGPSVLALPGAGKSFEQFRGDDYECRQFAQYQIGGSNANQAAADSTLKSAALGTAVGALAGAAIGGHEGAGAGAGTGLLMGTLVGSDAGRVSQGRTQKNYDNAYIQCMYAKGEQVPVSASSFHNRPATEAAPAAPATYYPPPPPPGSAPR